MHDDRVPAPLQRVLVHFAGVVCPPEIHTLGLVGDTVHELTQHLFAMPTHLRLGLFASFAAFDQGARLWPKARGRRFVDLDPTRAEAYFLAVAHAAGPQRKVAQIMKGLATLAYYELPQVKEALAYHPDAYIAQVAKRRLDSYAADIARVEAEVLTPMPTPPATQPLK